MQLLPSALSPEILQALPPDVDTYLVGGAVRDALLNRASHDLDFVVNADGRRVASAVADALGAAYYPLDDQHRTGRVVVPQADGTRMVLDFASMRGPDLESDLRARDFTINAIAMQLQAPQQLIDPLSGGAHLHARLLVPCSSSAFTDDPLRAVRAVRLATQFKLRIPTEALTSLREVVPLLGQISAERMRDEIFRILAGRRPASAVRVLEILGILAQVMPELGAMKSVTQSEPHTASVWTHTLRAMERLEALLAVLGPIHDPESGGDFALGLASRQIGRYRKEIHAHLSAELVRERPLRPLLFLAALYHDAGKPAAGREEPDGRLLFPDYEDQSAGLARDRAKSLRLSNQEAARLERIVRHHRRPRELVGAVSRAPKARQHDGSDAAGGPSRRDIYRYFRETGEAGVDICLLSLADTLATYGQRLPPEVWLSQLDAVRALLDAWWTGRDSTIDPAPLLGGQELIDRFGLSEGPEIGELLEKLKEGQAAGEISDLEQALSAVEGWLNG